nr:hypothetical protein [Tanacetum cinerariifolium]
MLTQQDMYVAGSKNRPPMLNKDNYVLWSSRLLCYAKSKPNGKLIYKSIMNGPYVRRMIPEPGDPDREVPVAETFNEQTNDELTEKEEIWLRVQQMMKGSDIGIQDKKAKFFNKWERFTSTDEESIESYYHHFSKLMNDFKRNKHFSEKIASNLKFLNNLQPEWRRHDTIVHQIKDLPEVDYTQLSTIIDYLHATTTTLKNFIPQPSFNTNYMQQPMPNPKDIIDPTTAMNMTHVLMAKAFKLNYSTPTNNNQRISSNPRNRQIAKPGMNMGQDRQMQMVEGNDGNQFKQYAGQNVRNQNRYNLLQNVRNQVVQNTVQNLGVQNVRNQNGLIVVLGIVNQNLNRYGNVVAARAEGNANEICFTVYFMPTIPKNNTLTSSVPGQVEFHGLKYRCKRFDLIEYENVLWERDVLTGIMLREKELLVAAFRCMK